MPDPIPTASPTEALADFLDEARPGPWRPETGIRDSEEDHLVYLTNDAQDTLFVNAVDVALLVNDAISRSLVPASSPAPDVVEALRRALPAAVNFRIPLAAPVNDRCWDEIAAELAVALPAQSEPAALDLGRLARAIHALRWCKDYSIWHDLAHDDEDEDGYRARLAAAYRAAEAEEQTDD